MKSKLRPDLVLPVTLFLLSGLPGTGSLVMLGVSAPPQLILGQSASLDCNFDLEGSKLYSVKWYKNGEEFFRYMPAMERQYDVFDVSGVNIDLAYSSYSTVHIPSVSLATEGIFRCEVSNEFPVFDTVSQSIKITVVAIPSGPHITPSPPLLVSPGYQLSLNCSLTGSLPLPNFHWYINKTPVTASYRGMFSQHGNAVSTLHTSKQEDGRMDCLLQLQFRVRDTHFQEGKIYLKCSALLGDFFMKSETLILEDERTIQKTANSENKVEGVIFTISSLVKIK